MKKIIYTMIICIFLCSCDTRIDYDYYVVNNCNKVIQLQFTDCEHNENQIIDIDPNMDKLIFQDTWINKIEPDIIEYTFASFIIIKDSDTSKVNYIDKNLWKFETTSESHAKYSLTVTPEDFE